MLKTRLIVALALCLPASFAAEDENGFVRLKPDEIKFEGDPNAVQITLISGNPEEEGFYILRARFGPGVFSSPHYHSTDRHVTVIKGTWYTGADASFDRDKTVPLGPGSSRIDNARESSRTSRARCRYEWLDQWGLPRARGAELRLDRRAARPSCLVDRRRRRVRRGNRPQSRDRLR